MGKASGCAAPKFISTPNTNVPPTLPSFETPEDGVRHVPTSLMLRVFHESYSNNLTYNDRHRSTDAAQRRQDRRAYLHIGEEHTTVMDRFKSSVSLGLKTGVIGAR